MAQKYEIFINHNILVLLPPDSDLPGKIPKEMVFHGVQNIPQALQNCKTPGNKNIVVTGTPDVLMDALQSRFTLLEAAGGIVTNNRREILFIMRNNVWDLPKGKIESGETPEIAAIRETEEESGISGTSIIHFFDYTYHTYIYQEKNILKKTWWYHMSANSDQPFKPQLEEGITKVAWLSPEELLPVFDNTYPNIKRLLSRFLQQNKL